MNDIMLVVLQELDKVLEILITVLTKQPASRSASLCERWRLLV